MKKSLALVDDWSNVASNNLSRAMSNRTLQADTDTKTRIITAAEPILLEKGFNGVGINEILKAVGIPKGSFYHWFPSKEQFGVEVLRHYATDALVQKRRWLSKRETLPDARERFVAYMESTCTCLLDKDCRQVCLIIKLMTEVSAFSEDMRRELAKFFADVVRLYQDVVEEGQAQGTINAKLNPAVAAGLVHDVWLGAYLRASVLYSVEPAREAIAFIRQYLAP